jgi:hypothetical protein
LQTLHIDCANGVGAWKLKAIVPLLAEAGLTVDLRNTGAGVLNGDCGSDFLQKDKKLPQNFGDVPAGARWGRGGLGAGTEARSRVPPLCCKPNVRTGG